LNNLNGLTSGVRLGFSAPTETNRFWFGLYRTQQRHTGSGRSTTDNGAVLDANIFGYSHTFGCYADSHADDMRVPYADRDRFIVPEGLSDKADVFPAEGFQRDCH